jgi:hypothetical protein
MTTIKKKTEIDYFGNEFKQICMMMTIKKKKPKIDYFGNEFLKNFCIKTANFRLSSPVKKSSL